METGFRRRGLLKEMDISALMEMRARGMTNKQIAERLDVSVSTVYHYIGKMPKDVLSIAHQNRARTDDSAVKVDIPYKPHEQPYEIPEAKPVLRLSEEIREYQGKTSFYKVNLTKQEVELFGGLVTGELRKENIYELIDELREVAMAMKGGKAK